MRYSTVYLLLMVLEKSRYWRIFDVLASTLYQSIGSRDNPTPANRIIVAIPLVHGSTYSIGYSLGEPRHILTFTYHQHTHTVHHNTINTNFQ